jgi:hypothetical protein
MSQVKKTNFGAKKALHRDIFLSFSHMTQKNVYFPAKLGVCILNVEVYARNFFLGFLIF